MPSIHTDEFVSHHLSRPVTLIGLMGSGKSTLGASLARRLGCPFMDSDAAIEAAAGKPIPAIFAEDGEEAFRALEQKTIADLIAAPGRSVIATGGGAVMRTATADLIFTSTLSVWIDVPLERLVERTSRQKNRPLLQSGDPGQILASLLEVRTPVYRRADIHLKDSDQPPSELCETLMRQIHEYLIEK